MKIDRILRALIPFLFAATLPAQTQPAAGMTPDWDVGVILREIAAHSGRLGLALEKLDAASWVAKGASDTYVAQFQSAKEQANALAAGAKDLAARPENLAAALETYFRMQGMETILGSLIEGARKYQSPAVAAELAKLVAENGANRERFQRWIVDLAAEREQQFRVMDSEAQRCRGFLARQPSEAPKNSGRKK